MAGGFNPKVAEVLGQVGVDPTHAEKREREERGRVHPRIARLLNEEMGIRYREEDVITEQPAQGRANPLDAAGDDPIAGTTGQGDSQQDQGAQDAGQKPPKPSVQLKSTSGNGKTLDDLSRALGKVSESMRDLETIIQTLRKKSPDVKDHAAVLRSYFEDIEETLAPFKRMVD